MLRLFEIIEKRKKLFWYITLFYIVFNGSFIYPISFENGVQNSFLLTTILAYLSVSLLLTRLLPNAYLKVYSITLPLTIVGMGIRYLIELGHNSIPVLFSTLNVVVYIVAVPLFVLLGYHFISKFDFDKKQS